MRAVSVIRVLAIMVLIGIVVIFIYFLSDAP